MGGGGKPAKQESTTELPDWVRDKYEQEWEQGGKLYEAATEIASNQDPRTVLGMNEYEDMGLDAALQGIATGEDFLTAAGDFSGIDQALAGMNVNVADYDRLIGEAMGLEDYTSNRIGDKTLDEMRASYESDYTDDVVDTTLAASDRERERARLAEQARASNVGGTSNTRSAIAQAVGDNLYELSRAQTEAQLRDDAFRTAAEFGQSEAQLGQAEDQMNYGFKSDALGLGADLTAGQASLLDTILAGEQGRREALEGLSGAWTGLGTTKGGILSQYGETARALEQAGMDAEWSHDMDMTNWLAGILGATSADKPSGVGTTTGTQQEATPGMGQTLLGLGSTILGGWLSDEDAKQDISDFEGDALEEISSLDLKEYSYKDDAPGHRKDRHAGLIAQDVAAKVDGATYVGEDGLLRIDPRVMTSKMAKAIGQLADEAKPHRKWKRGVAA